MGSVRSYFFNLQLDFILLHSGIGYRLFKAHLLHCRWAYLVSAFAKARPTCLYTYLIIQTAVYYKPACSISSRVGEYLFDSKYSDRFVNIILLH